MNSAAELKRHNESQAFEQAKDKVVNALKSDPLGLSISQLMTICRLSIKTVKDVLTGTDFKSEEGVFFLANAEQIKPELVNKPQVKVTKSVELANENKPVPERRDICKGMVELLENSGTGLSMDKIKSQLGLTNRQVHQAMYRIKKTYPLQVIESDDGLVYMLASSESEIISKPIDTPAVAPSFDADQPVEQKPVPVLMPVPTATEILKSQISTVVTRRSQLTLDVNQLKILLSEIFGLEEVRIWMEQGEFKGAYLFGEEKEAV
ncbi:hypothetical protein [Acinetobacter sp. WCHAc060025]|uniref:hypothetical protein n=1 Tax=Acinetobacter sp. WCHAc060025 TaxID=2518625 RepID=UPI001023E42E|nr:hypothetical protein [Acinetobacter sp. WCHAc060025]RZG72445.1 hypothetical protein EXE09_17145 [Acinetobacter sp. WCHAc060025]